MWVSRFSLHNYKSFRTTGQLTFKPGFNIIVGPNNAGKTALLEGITLRFSSVAHRSTLTRPTAMASDSPISYADISLIATGSEVRDVITSIGASKFHIPLPTGHAHNSGQSFMDNLLQASELTFNIRYQVQQSSAGQIMRQKYPTLSTYTPNMEHQTGNRLMFQYGVNVAQREITFMSAAHAAEGADFFLNVAQTLAARIYNFQAERFNVGEQAFGSNSVLASNASNLPETLHLLQTTKPKRYAKFVEYVREVFPAIHYLSVRPKPGGGGNNLQEVIVWTEPDALDRNDLAFTLKESGTGIGQVIAMLYVALNADYPQTIIIDEPNSFLHPAASRKLIAILKEFPQHQYIVSTHSPEVIQAATPSTIVLLTRDPMESQARELNITQIESYQLCLSHLGVRLSDVFGADNVIWVEGLTEERLFPRLLPLVNDVNKHQVTSVLAVKHADDFRPNKLKRLRLILDLYRKLSSAGSLVPTTLGFIVDPEDLSDQDKTDIRKESTGLVRFLPRRMFENYLINAEAITALINMLPSFQGNPIEQKTVEAWLEAHGREKKYFEPLPKHDTLFGIEWLTNVNGALLLDTLISQISDEKERYNKLVHGQALFEYLYAKYPGHFREIELLLNDVIGKT